jgi:hypothetical protein
LILVGVKVERTLANWSAFLVCEDVIFLQKEQEPRLCGWQAGCYWD